MTPAEREWWLRTLIIVRCCRDWPVTPWMGWGSCGYCHNVPVRTEKTIQQYMNEREAARCTTPTS